jgi:hypothetical protein
MEAALARNAVAHFDRQCRDPDIPRSWRWYLFAIEIGKGAVGGAGLFIALAGLYHLLLLLATVEVSASTTLLYLMSIIGALLGGIYACLRPLLRSRKMTL